MRGDCLIQSDSGRLWNTEQGEVRAGGTGLPGGRVLQADGTASAKALRLKSPGQGGQGGWNRVMEEMKVKRPEGWVGAGMKAGWCQVIEQNQDAFWKQNQ